MRVKLSMLATMACALTMAIPLGAGSRPAEKTNKNMTKTAAMRSVWPAETLSGKITMVDPARKLVVVEPSDGVPFDMVVTANTRIKAGDQAIALKDLTREMNRTVSVRFNPERRGDVATSIHVNG
jgi:hypothetical protein